MPDLPHVLVEEGDGLGDRIGREQMGFDMGLTFEPINFMRDVIFFQLSDECLWVLNRDELIASAMINKRGRAVPRYMGDRRCRAVNGLISSQRPA